MNKKKRASSCILKRDRTLEIKFNLKTKNMLLTNCLDLKLAAKISVLLIAVFLLYFVRLLIKLALFRVINFPLDWLGI